MTGARSQAKGGGQRVVTPVRQQDGTPVSGSGAPGPPGPAGPPGAPGPPGTAGSTYRYQFSTTTTPPPTGNQIRFDAGFPYDTVTRVWVRNETSDSVDVSGILRLTPVGAVLYVQDRDDATRYVRFETTGDPVPGTGDVEFPVVWVAGGAALLAQQVILFLGPGASSGGGTPDPHALTHNMDGTDPLQLDKLTINVGDQPTYEGIRLLLTGGTVGAGYLFTYNDVDVGGLYLVAGDPPGITLDAKTAGGFAGSEIRFALDGNPRVVIGLDGRVTLRRSQSGAGSVGAARALRLVNVSGGPGEHQEIGFGYSGGVYQPVVIGHAITDPAGLTAGDAYIATRALTTDTPPIRRLTVTAAGDVVLSQSLAWGGGAAIPSSSGVVLVGSAPAAHHASHEPGGADPLAVDAAAAVGSLRTLGTGATQAAPGNDARFGGAPAAHHASHEPGGADAIAALSAAVLTSGTVPDARFPATLPAVSGANLTNLNATNLASGAVPDARLSANVARRDQANTFVGNNEILKAAPVLTLTDSAAPANAKGFRFINTSQALFVQALNDAGAVLASPMVLNRSGDLAPSRDIYEKGRTTAMGHPVTVPYAAGNYTASGSMVWTVEAGDQALSVYSVVGKTIFWAVQIATASISGTPSTDVYIACPAGLAIVQGVTKSLLAQDASGAFDVLITSYDGAKVRASKVSGANWAASTNNMYLYFTGIFFLA